MGRDSDEDSLRTVMAEIDADGDGQVDFDEFQAWFFKHASSKEQEQLYIVYYESSTDSATEEQGQVCETTMDRLPQLLAYGVITVDTRVWMDGMDDWRTLSESSLRGQDFTATVQQALDAGSDEQKTNLLESIWTRVCVNGKAVEAELRLFLETMGEIEPGEVGESAFQGVVADMDADGDGQIDFDEFVGWFLKRNEGPDRELRAVLEELKFMHYAQVLAESGFRTLASLSWEACSRSDLQGAGMKISEAKRLLNAVKDALQED